ncbi:juvenile hormone esterase-like [Chrysoperla carnea]|uniref:juvenile hormone esterase-like n=1 Tax=Chrysoperla carnea TaxID=189513 RepID=UPI001D06BF15|nr:juvenile hormone esterase-like [Chrysoperla carnea]
MKFVLLVICIIISLDCVRSKNTFKEDIKITIKQGSLVGHSAKDYLNDTYYIFEAIPYAKPPVGRLRFKAPEPAEPWTGVYDATKIRKACPQVGASEAGPNEEYDEDCLFLNVHTKMMPDPKPVMVWIHGGAFEMGSINGYRGSQYLMTEDIVLVEVQYRLNIFGFLSFDDPKYNIPGNAGLKDQVLALKWVQENIKYFNGDPNQVTIFGDSAGGASVHLLYVSSLAKGLFHRAIAQSGSGANTWVYSASNYTHLAEALNCSSNNLDEIVNCINGTSTKELVNAGIILKSIPDGTLVDGISMSALTIESENSNDPFMTHHVEENIKKGNFNKVPLIIGICANESALYYQDRPGIGPNFTESDYEKLIPKDINFKKGSNEAFNIGKEIKEFYYGNQTPSNDLLEPWIKYVSDMMFIYKMYYITKLQAASFPNVPVYFYNFNYITSLNFEGNSTKYVAHADDLPYLFNFNPKGVSQLTPSSDEEIGMHRMIKLWTTFAKSKDGNPNPLNDPLFTNVTWKPVDSNNFFYLHINPKLVLEKNLYEDRMKFWDHFYQKYQI